MGALDNVRAEVTTYHKTYAVGETAADALAAWWLTSRYEVAPADAIARAPGGNHDYGIDGFHIERRASEPPVLHLIQAKFSSNRSEIRKGVAGFERAMQEIRPLLEGRFGEAPVQNPVLPRLAAVLEKNGDLLPELRLHFEVLHLCSEEGEALQRFLESAVERFKDAAAQYLPEHVCTVRAILPSSELRSERGETVIPATKQVMRFSGDEIPAGEGVHYYAGIGFLADLVELYRTNGEALFAKNVRHYLYKATERGPAKYMRDTLRAVCVRSSGEGFKADPERFAILHNGVTIHAKWAERSNGRLELREPSVLNGCQTVKNAYLFSQETTVRDRIDRERWARIPVPVRVITTRDESLVRDVTVSNNRQNSLRPSAFRANEPGQLDLAERFRRVGIYYERQEEAFNNLRRARPADFETEYPNSFERPITMEELAQVIATVSDRPALSVAAKVSELFDDSVYKQIFAEEKLGNIELLVFLRNVAAAMPLVLKDLKSRNRIFDNLPLTRFRFPATKLMVRFIVNRKPELVHEFGEVVYGRIGTEHPLRKRLLALTSAQNSGLQQVLPDTWFDRDAKGEWRTATDPQLVAKALRAMRLTDVDVFAES